MIDLDRLHMDAAGPQSGRTIGLLVSAVQLLDFHDEVAFIAQSEWDVKRLSLDLEVVCASLGFEINKKASKRPGSHWWIENKRFYLIHSRDAYLIQWNCPIVLDHTMLKPEKEYEFTFLLCGDVDVVTKALENHYNILDDALIFVRNGIPGVAFSRRASSLIEALVSAEDDMLACGVKINKVTFG